MQDGRPRTPPSVVCLAPIKVRKTPNPPGALTMDKYKKRPAASLSGPRVYSTDMHPRMLDGAPAADLETTTLRGLKVKLLTKGIVTVNGGHLLHPRAITLLERNEELLTLGLLLPAIREDKASFQAYVPDYQSHGWNDARVRSAVQFLEDRVRCSFSKTA